MGCGVFEGDLYAIGGQGDNNMLRLRGKSWAPVMRLNEPLHHSVMYSTPGCIYVLGGLKGKQPQDKCWRWTSMPETPNAWSPFAPLPSALAEMAGCGNDGHIYISGGFGADKAVVPHLWCWTEKTNTWDTGLPPMSVARSSHCCVSVEGKYVYAVGGWGNVGGVQTRLDSVERYDVAAKKWETVAPMAEARVHAGVAWLDGKVYVCGGEGAAPAPHNRKPLSSVERYDPETNTWKVCTPMLNPRYQFGYTVIPPTAHAALKKSAA